MDQQAAIDLIVSAFKARGLHAKKACTIQILNAIFSIYAFDLKEFKQKYRLSTSQYEKLLSVLLYAIYYSEILIDQLPKELCYLEYHCLTLLAEFSESKTFLTKLSSHEQLHLLSHILRYPREGTWIILNELKTIHSDKKIWLDLLNGLSQKFYDLALFETLIDKLHLEDLVKKLEFHALHIVEEILKILPHVLDAIVDSPVKGINEIQQQKDKIFSTSTSSSNEMNVREAQARLLTIFSSFRTQTYSLVEGREFFYLFGLYGHYLDTPSMNYSSAPLNERLHAIYHLFQTPSHLYPEDLNLLIPFVLSICQKLYFFLKDPKKIADGLNRLVYAVATNGQHFPEKCWLPSILEGLTSLIAHFHSKGIKEISLASQPIVIFDQASPAMLKINLEYTGQLEKAYGARICHFSYSQTLQLARKLNLTFWIKTTSKKNFGYGGARNCLFMLAPVVHYFIRKQKYSPQELLQIPKKELLHVFNQVVLGTEGKDAIIHLGEDDVYIPRCNIISDAIFSEQCQHLYFKRAAYAIGRNTMHVNIGVDLESLMQNPSHLFASTAWQDEPSPAGIKGMLSKPVFCLPLPFGAEERQVIPPYFFYDLFQQPVVHLGGMRFPNKLFPAAPLDGIEEYLYTYLPYCVQITMVGTLINRLSNGILHWNSHEGHVPEQIHTLGELWQYVFNHHSQHSFNANFWNTLELVFEKDFAQAFPTMEKLASVKSETLKKAPHLQHYYEALKQDAICFKALGCVVVVKHRQGLINPLKEALKEVQAQFQIDISKTVLTSSLSLLIKQMLSFGKR